MTNHLRLVNLAPQSAQQTVRVRALHQNASGLLTALASGSRSFTLFGDIADQVKAKGINPVLMLRCGNTETSYDPKNIRNILKSAVAGNFHPGKWYEFGRRLLVCRTGLNVVVVSRKELELDKMFNDFFAGLRDVYAVLSGKIFQLELARNATKTPQLCSLDEKRYIYQQLIELNSKPYGKIFLERVSCLGSKNYLQKQLPVVKEVLDAYARANQLKALLAEIKNAKVCIVHQISPLMPCPGVIVAYTL